ncbi:alanine--glyoxylate aminotransferase family protein [Candidatus Saganbacteria bacterium]|uniref:Alanine--glyoxylate aminotransferase family protein n=1 Tax=Candidatus Saganbacteria bacterium TaxID=2575572 RepID=A0A9D6UKJ4_UNCSA|nr:alanine--glyoxylate aminotransferase family protein [Candidatus Saganbacteria bacterium]
MARKMIKYNLMIPGPTPIPTRVLSAMNHDMIGHRGPLFSAVMKEVMEGLRWAYETKNEIFIYPSSGTGGMEAAVVNTLSPGDKVIVLNIGNFGSRFAKICKAYGMEVNDVKFERGKPADEGTLEAELKEGPVKAVLFQHNETSTGVLNAVETLAKTVRKNQPEALIIVDAVSGLMAAPLKTDEWDLDVVVSGSQKAFMTPPGVAAVSISERAWKAHAVSKCPRHYWDFALMKEEAPKGHTYTTPPESLIFGLREGLNMLKEEGRENVFARHKANRDLVRAAARGLGLKLLADDACASPAVTAISPPEGVDAEEVRKLMRDDFGVEVAPGQSELKGKIFRIGHLGYVDSLDIIGAFAALEALFRRLGAKTNFGAGVRAAMELL